jgi:ferredoxin
MAVQVSVDHNKCVGSQMCVYVAPEMFALDAGGQAEVKQLVSRDKAIEAAEQCPMEAISVFEDGQVLAP